jgi:hypothetical protein
MAPKSKRRSQLLTAQPQTRSPLCLPSELRRRGTAMLNIQGWCWGRDICRAEGNLLLQHGFERHRPPTGKLGSSAYTRDLDATRSVVLWGFGIFYRDLQYGAVVLPRAGFTPQLTSSRTLPSQIWEMAQLPPVYTPANIQEWRSLFALLTPMLSWIADYERWVIADYGIEYRNRCLAEWKRATMPASEIAATWQQLADRSAQRARALDQHAMLLAERAEALAAS